MTAHVEFLLAAREELDSAFAWYLRHNDRAASGLLREVVNGLQVIAGAPEVWPEFQADTRRYPLRKYPFFLVYRVVAGRVVIIAVAHQRRSPGYWSRR